MRLLRHDTTGQPTGHGHDHADAVDVLTAATAMGITPDAVRKRLVRGQLAGLKRAGRWLVLLPLPTEPIVVLDTTAAGSDRTADGTATGQDTRPDTPAVDAVYREMIEQLRGEVSFLREELRRKDTLIAAFAQRPAWLSSPVSDTTWTGHDRTGRPRRPWWRRVIDALLNG